MQKICAGVTRTGDLRFHASFPATDTGMVLPKPEPLNGMHRGADIKDLAQSLAHVVVVIASQSCPTLRPHGLEPAGLLCPWDSPGKNTAAGSHSLLQGIFSTQGSNTCLLDSFRFFTAEPSGLAHGTPHFQRRLGLNYSDCFQQASEASMAIMKER